VLTTRARILLPYVLDVFKVSRNVLDLVSLPEQNLQPVTASRTKHKQMAALRILSNDRSYSFGRRSNPQRMSVASLAIQIRPPCPRSIACKLGSPIILRTLPPRAVLAHAPRRIPSSRSGSGRSSIGFQHPHRRTCSVSAPSLTLPGNSSACPAVAVSSRQKSTAGTNRAHGKTHSPSVRYVPARTPAFATLPMLSLIVASCHIIAMSRGLSQDGVRLALTVFRSGSNIPPRCPRDGRINVHK